jgi:thymidylate synthase (FAD)
VRIDLIDVCASDLKVANSARVSLDRWHDEFVFDGDIENDEQLIHWLMKKHHGSPFEKGYFEFRVEAPIFVFREWQRHRAGHSFNEMSGRYTELEEKFYLPERFRAQIGKPGAYSFMEIDFDDERTARWLEIMSLTYETCWDTYQQFLREGMAKEQARAVLPLGIYSKMIWSCNPRSLLHFCSLRNHPDAQAEIRTLAAQAEAALADYMPVTAEAFNHYERKAP